jgi:TPR repeat protein
MARRVRKKAPEETRFARASHLLDKGRIREAFRLFLELAREGDADAQVGVGYCYDTGQGVQHSRTDAMHWYRKAVQQGSAAAANNIGTIYRDEGRLRLALRWFGHAVTMGEDDALLELARLHLGPLADPATARKLLSRVLKSKQVTLDSQEQAERLLRTLEQRQRLSRSR